MRASVGSGGRFADDPGIHVDEMKPRRPSLRVSVVTETFPPEVNGVAATLAHLVDGLVGRGHALQLVRPRQRADGEERQAGRIDEVLLQGLPIPRYPDLKMGVPSKRALVRLWSLHRPDVVHIATEGPLGWSALQAAEFLKLPMVSDFRTNFHAYSRHYGIGWLQRPILAYLRKFHNRTSTTMVPTEALKRELDGCGFRNLRVIARGVDTQLFSPTRRDDALRAQWGAGSDTLVVLYVGRMAAEKNLAALVSAYEAMRTERPDLRLVMVGDGPIRSELQQRCPQALFTGVLHGETLARHFASADVFLFPSLTETYGNVTPEAMASGLAVVAFDHAAAAALIDSGESGLLARPEAAVEFVELAKRLAGDDALIRGLGRRARDVASGIGWPRIVDQVEQVLFAAQEGRTLPFDVGIARAAT